MMKKKKKKVQKDARIHPICQKAYLSSLESDLEESEEKEEVKEEEEEDEKAKTNCEWKTIGG